MAQIGMAAGPMENALQQNRRSRRAVRAQSSGQRLGFLSSEIVQFDPPPDVKRSDARVANQVARRGDTQQTERQTVELGVFRTPVVALPNRGKEFIGGKRQAPDAVNFIEEN